MEENIKNKVLGIFSKYKLSLLVVFGSYNSKKFNKNSDIDLAIKVEKPDNLLKNRTKILNEISEIFNYRDIDLILLNYAEPLIKYKIACEAKLLYEKEKGIFKKFQVRAMGEHNDAQKFYELDKKYINDFLEGKNKNGRQNVSPPKTK